MCLWKVKEGWNSLKVFCVCRRGQGKAQIYLIRSSSSQVPLYLSAQLPFLLALCLLMQSTQSNNSFDCNFPTMTGPGGQRVDLRIDFMASIGLKKMNQMSHIIMDLINQDYCR